MRAEWQAAILLTVWLMVLIFVWANERIVW